MLAIRTETPVDYQAVEELTRRYDDALPSMEKKRRPFQEEFYIMSHAMLE